MMSMFNEQGQFIKKDALPPTESQIITPEMLIKHLRIMEEMIIKSAQQKQLSPDGAMKIIKNISDTCLKLNSERLISQQLESGLETKKKY